MVKDRDEVLRELIDIQYNRNDMDIQRATFRVRGDVVEVYPAQDVYKRQMWDRPSSIVCSENISRHPLIRSAL